MNINRLHFVDPSNVTGLGSTKGDLFSTDTNGGLTTISTGPNGYVLSANSGTTSGLEWLDSSTLEFDGTIEDSAFTIFNTADDSKKIQFDASDIASGTTRTFTAPDTSMILVGQTGNGLFDHTSLGMSDTATEFTSIAINGNLSPDISRYLSFRSVGFPDNGLAGVTFSGDDGDGAFITPDNYQFVMYAASASWRLMKRVTTGSPPPMPFINGTIMSIPMNTSSAIRFHKTGEGDSVYTQLNTSSLTTTRTLTAPDKSGTIALTTDIVAAQEFIALNDTPSAYTSAANQILSVNGAEDAVIFPVIVVGSISGQTNTGDSLAFGLNSSVNTSGSIAIGNTAVAANANSISIGPNVNSSTNMISIGHDFTVPAVSSNSIIMGEDLTITTSALNSIILNVEGVASSSFNTVANCISIGRRNGIGLNGTNIICIGDTADVGDNSNRVLCIGNSVSGGLATGSDCVDCILIGNPFMDSNDTQNIYIGDASDIGNNSDNIIMGYTSIFYYNDKNVIIGGHTQVSGEPVISSTFANSSVAIGYNSAAGGSSNGVVSIGSEIKNQVSNTNRIRGFSLGAMSDRPNLNCSAKMGVITQEINLNVLGTTDISVPSPSSGTDPLFYPTEINIYQVSPGSASSPVIDFGTSTNATLWKNFTTYDPTLAAHKRTTINTLDSTDGTAGTLRVTVSTASTDQCLTRIQWVGFLVLFDDY